MSGIILNEGQEYAHNAISSGRNVFLTGRAGTGKSVVVSKVTTPSTIVCSSTGISALNVGGETLHRVFGLPLGLVTLKERNIIPKRVAEIFEDGLVDRIISDEISMTRPDHLDLINYYLKVVTGSNKPFGGIQFIPTGDFYQLESIVGNSEKQHFYEDYNTNFAFGAACWDFETVELKQVMRNGNKVQVNMLNAIREKDENLWRKAINGINAMARPLHELEDAIHLCCYNADADAINQERLAAHDGKMHVFYSKADNFSKSELPVAEELILKEGCRVMIKANDKDGSYVNGDRGILVSCLDDALVVELDRGGRVIVNKFNWDKSEYKKIDGKLEKVITGSFCQYPITLAYAISIHKSQGLTLDKCILDTGGGCFSHGQLYTAISRISDLTNMGLVNRILPRDLIVKKEVKDFYKRTQR